MSFNGAFNFNFVLQEMKISFFYVISRSVARFFLRRASVDANWRNENNIYTNHFSVEGDRKKADII